VELAQAAVALALVDVAVDVELDAVDVRPGPVDVVDVQPAAALADLVGLVDLADPPVILEEVTEPVTLLLTTSIT